MSIQRLRDCTRGGAANSTRSTAWPSGSTTGTVLTGRKLVSSPLSAERTDRAYPACVWPPAWLVGLRSA
jgi:hypothetical protein